MRTLAFNVTVVDSDGKDVRLTTESGHAFSLPVAHAPALCAPGSSFCLDLGSLATAPLADHARATAGRALLNEILTAT